MPTARLASLLVLAALVPLAAAQPLVLAPRADADATLPPSIRAYDVTRSGSPTVLASLLRADLAAEDWMLDAVLSDQGSETVASFASDAGVLAAVNGGYFGGTQSYSLVRNDGVTLVPNIGALDRSGTLYYPTRGAVGVSASRTPDVAWVYTLGGTTYAYPAPSPNAPGAPQPQPTAAFPAGGAPWGVTTAIGGGPVLVQNGRAQLTWTEEVFFGGSGVDTTSARARTAVGYTATGQLLVLAVPEARGLTLPALAALLVELGAVEAVNLDGGGSTALSVGTLALVPSSRPVVSALRLRGSTTGGLPPPTILDTGDAIYRETGAWFESANTPYWGATPSRLNVVGTGTDRAVFVVPSTINWPVFTVMAWWTPSANRATNTPFTVYRSGVGETVLVDQSDPATSARWNYLGTFMLAPGDSVVVTDDATGTTSPAYVSVDALRLVPFNIAATDDAPTTGPTLRVGPNPATDVVDATVGMDAPGTVRVEVLDALGRIVRRTVREGVGEVRLRLDVRGLAPGVYAVRATTAAGTRTQTVTVTR